MGRLDWKDTSMISSKELLKTYRVKQTDMKASVLRFEGVGEKDVYNITAPFELDGKLVIAGRVEARENEHSEIWLFTEASDTAWVPLQGSVKLPLQDPFYTIIKGNIILGGVEVVFSSDGQAQWRTVFYHLQSMSTAKKIFAGPWGMKDLRLKELKDGQILVLTRPQGEKGGRGKIGAFLVKSLAELSVEGIENAPLLTNQFIDSEWGGGNEIHQIDEEIWVLGHIANFDNAGDRHYYALAFKLDLERLQMTDAKIIAERRDFAESPTKRPDLTDVVFSGGLILNKDRAVLYAGISDAGAQKIEIKNPFR